MKRTINFAFFNLPFRQRGIAVGASLIRRKKIGHLGYITLWVGDR